MKQEIFRKDTQFEVPEWQKRIVRQRIKNAKPETFTPFAEVRERLKKKHGL